MDGSLGEQSQIRWNNNGFELLSIKSDDCLATYKESKSELIIIVLKAKNSTIKIFLISSKHTEHKCIDYNHCIICYVHEIWLTYY